MSSDKYIHTEVENKIYTYWKKIIYLNQKKALKSFLL